MRRERLGRDDGDLRAGVQIDAAAALARDGAADDVDDAEHASAFALHFLDRGERVEGFARLADGDVERVLLDRRDCDSETRRLAPRARERAPAAR